MVHPCFSHKHRSLKLSKNKMNKRQPDLLERHHSKVPRRQPSLHLFQHSRWLPLKPILFLIFPPLEYPRAICSLSFPFFFPPEKPSLKLPIFLFSLASISFPPKITSFASPSLYCPSHLFSKTMKTKGKKKTSSLLFF